MGSHRCEIDASAGPARGSVVGGRGQLLVRVCLFDGPGVVDGATGLPAGEQDVYTDLRPCQARKLAGRLIACAEQADRITERSGGWQR
jgi:hypothetical protein